MTSNLYVIDTKNNRDLHWQNQFYKLLHSYIFEFNKLHIKYLINEVLITYLTHNYLFYMLILISIFEIQTTQFLP